MDKTTEYESTAQLLADILAELFPGVLDDDELKDVAERIEFYFMTKLMEKHGQR